MSDEGIAEDFVSVWFSIVRPYECMQTRKKRLCLSDDSRQLENLLSFMLKGSTFNQSRQMIPSHQSNE